MISRRRYELPTPLRNSKLSKIQSSLSVTKVYDTISVTRVERRFRSIAIPFAFRSIPQPCDARTCTAPRRTAPHGTPPRRPPREVIMRPSPRVPQILRKAPRRAHPAQHGITSCVRSLRAVAGSGGSRHAPPGPHVHGHVVASHADVAAVMPARAERRCRASSAPPGDDACENWALRPTCA